MPPSVWPKPRNAGPNFAVIPLVVALTTSILFALARAASEPIQTSNMTTSSIINPTKASGPLEQANATGETPRESDGLFSFNNSDDDGDDDISDKSSSLAKSFVLVATGDKVKLYPSAQEAPGELSDNSNNGYAIKSDYANYPDASKLNLKTPYARWLVEKRLADANESSPRLVSILPASESDDTTLNGDGLQRPLVTDVDYMFDGKFCDHSDRQQQQTVADETCLVIVWLDKANLLIRFGSIDLDKQPIRVMKEQTKGKSSLLLREFVPIDVFRNAELDDDARATTTTRVIHSIRLDRRRKRLGAAFGFGANYVNRILVGQLWPDNYQHQLKDEHIYSLAGCQAAQAGLNVDGASEFRFDFDQDRDDAIYATDKFDNGRFSVIQLAKRDSLGAQADFVVHHDVARLVAGDSHLSRPAHLRPLACFKAAAVDRSRLLVVLGQNNQLYRCLLRQQAQLQCQQIGQLATGKPSIREPYAMELLDGRLYLSEPSKKTLVVVSVADQSPELGLASTSGRVVLVESPTIFGFRVGKLTRPYDDSQAKPWTFKQQQASACFYGKPAPQSLDTCGAPRDQCEGLAELKVLILILCLASILLLLPALWKRISTTRVIASNMSQRQDLEKASYETENNNNNNNKSTTSGRLIAP